MLTSLSVMRNRVDRPKKRVDLDSEGEDHPRCRRRLRVHRIWRVRTIHLVDAGKVPGTTSQLRVNLSDLIMILYALLRLWLDSPGKNTFKERLFSSKIEADVSANCLT
jgi:hypothetical protein